MSRVELPQDVVVLYLIEVGLIESEADFRGMLKVVCSGEVTVRDLVIATIGLLMQLGNLRLTAIMHTLAALKEEPASVIETAAVAVVNGDTLILPRGQDSVRILHLGTMREIDEAPPAFVSTIYSCTAVWEQALKVLR